MIDGSSKRTDDAAAWTIVAALAIACPFALRGEGFVVALPAALLPGLGLLVLIGAAWVGHARRRPRLAAGATAFAQMTLFTLLAVTLAYALAARGGPLWDARLAAADARLGLRWPAILSVADTTPALLWLGGVAYGSLIAQMVAAIVILSAAGRLAELRIAVTAAIGSGAATVAIAGLVPAMGNLFDPALHQHLPASIAWQERGLIAGLRDGTGRVLDYGRLMGIVSFPSYHATLPVILAWSLRDVRGVGVAAAIWAALTILATPLFGGHYGVDVLGGLGLAALALPLAACAVRWRPASIGGKGRVTVRHRVPVRDIVEQASGPPAGRLAAEGMG